VQAQFRHAIHVLYSWRPENCFIRGVHDSAPAVLLPQVTHSNQCIIMERAFPTTPRAPCRSFSSRGSCRFGNRCRFSHGMGWQTSRPPPELTSCFHWEDAGTCPRGDRCASLHRLQVLGGASLLHDNLPEEIYTFVVVKPLAPRNSATPTNLQFVASYDWLIAENPTIGFQVRFSGTRILPVQTRLT
jgi:hypothetical protein